jgi:hypothetical protein
MKRRYKNRDRSYSRGQRNKKNQNSARYSSDSATDTSFSADTRHSSALVQDEPSASGNTTKRIEVRNSPQLELVQNKTLDLLEDNMAENEKRK